MERLKKIIKKKYPKGLDYEFTKEEKTGYLIAIKDMREICEMAETEGLRIGDVKGSAYRDELIHKIESMKKIASKMFGDEDFRKGNDTALDNFKVHVRELYNKHYS